MACDCPRAPCLRRARAEPTPFSIVFGVHQQAHSAPLKPDNLHNAFALDSSAGFPVGPLELLGNLVLVAIFIFASSRFQLQQNGVWFNFFLIPWSSIRAYELEPNNGWYPELKLVLRGNFMLWQKMLELTLPREAAPAAARCLEQHIVKTTGA